MHVSGEWISATYEMKPTKDDPQGAGSVITYQRRYALGAALGLNIDEDDDGNKACIPPKITKPKFEDNLIKGTAAWIVKNPANTIEAMEVKYEITEAQKMAIKAAVLILKKEAQTPPQQ
jgi:hypothetical protein